MTKEIKLPTYENGTPVCFGDTVLDKNGISFIVSIVKAYSDGTIIFDGKDARENHRSLFTSVGAFVKRGDTWEQLEEDVEKKPCIYFGMAVSITCSGCPISNKRITDDGARTISCRTLQLKDIVRRAKKLAGVEDE